MSQDVNVLYDMHTTLTEVIAWSLRKIVTAYTDEYNRQLWTMANSFVTRYDRNQPLRITLPNTVRLDVMATREYSLVPSRLHPTIRVFLPDASNPIQFPRNSVREIGVTTSVSESKVDFTLRSIYVNNILTGGDENALETARIAWLGMTSHIPDDYTLV